MTTLYELGQLAALEKEKRALIEELDDIEATMNAVTTRLTGMPGSRGRDKADIILLHAQTVDLLTAKIKECSGKYVETYKYIDSVPDSEVRTIMMQKFLKLKSWQGVADFVGGYATADSCRMIVKRYLEKEVNNDICN